jgi:lysophospholipase L1-like esterase
MQLLVLGDSIARGDEATSVEQSFVGIVAGQLGAATSYFCRGGATSSTGAEWCNYVWTAPQADLVIVSYGMNDQTLEGLWLRRRVRVEPDRYRQNVTEIVRGVRGRRDVPVLLVAPPPAHPEWEGSSGRTLEYLAALREIGEPVAEVPSIWGDPRRLMANGKNHPGDEGHRLIAEACLAALTEAGTAASHARPAKS